MKNTKQGKTSPETQQENTNTKTKTNSAAGDVQHNQSTSPNKQDSRSNESPMPKDTQGKNKSGNKSNNHRGRL